VRLKAGYRDQLRLTHTVPKVNRPAREKKKVAGDSEVSPADENGRYTMKKKHF